MANAPANPFGEFEDDFAKTDKAAAGSAPGRVPPECYKFVLTSVDLKGDGVLVDHEAFVANSGTKGFKLFCEILSPESVPNPVTNEPHATKGVVLEHVFWITQKTLPFVKRDLATILERDDFKITEVVSLIWAGRTFEGVVRDEKRDGYVNSRISYINPWTPPKDGEKKEASKESQKETKKADAKGAATKTAQQASAGKGGAADF